VCSGALLVYLGCLLLNWGLSDLILVLDFDGRGARNFESWNRPFLIKPASVILVIWLVSTLNFAVLLVLRSWIEGRFELLIFPADQWWVIPSFPSCVCAAVPVLVQHLGAVFCFPVLSGICAYVHVCSCVLLAVCFASDLLSFFLFCWSGLLLGCVGLLCWLAKCWYRWYQPSVATGTVRLCLPALDLTGTLFAMICNLKGWYVNYPHSVY